MSQEELTIQIAATLHTADERGVLEDACAEFTEPLAELFERLLAQERRKERKEVLYDVLAFNCGLGCTPQEGYKDLTDALRDTKHLVAGVLRAEREKVREKCAVEAKEQIDLAIESMYISGSRSALGTVVAEHIRQLDLTAPSSTDERKI